MLNCNKLLALSKLSGKLKQIFCFFCSIVHLAISLSCLLPLSDLLLSPSKVTIVGNIRIDAENDSLNIVPILLLD